MKRTSCLIGAIAALAMPCVACDGDDGSGGSGAGGGGGTAEPPEVVADDGCTEDHPNRLTNQGRTADLFITCSTDDGSSLLLKNTTSGLVLVVRPGDVSNQPQMSVSPSDDPSFKEQAVNQAAPLDCLDLTDSCLLTPSSTLTAQVSSGVVRLTVDVASEATARATFANSYAGYIQSKLISRPAKFVDSISSCATSAEQAAEAHQVLADAVRDSVAASAACGSLVDEVAREVNEPVPQAEEEAGEQLLSHAGEYTADLRRDFKVYAAIEVISRLRP